ncbi:MAG: preprotein translocase subunit SecA [Phycisphaerales bacterium]
MSVIAPVKKVAIKIFGSRNERLVKRYAKRVTEINALEPKIRKLTDEELRKRTVELRQAVKDGAGDQQVLPEVFAIMREAMDRNIGIRNIFNPAHQFDPRKLSAETQKLYAQVADQIAAMPERTVLGSDVPVPSWYCVDIPNAIYEAVRDLYPESRPPFRARSFDVQLIGGMVLYEGRIAEMKTGEGKTIVAPLACFMAAVAGYQCHVVTVNDYLVQRDRDWVFPAFHALGLHAGAIHPYHMQPPEGKQRAYQCDVVYGTNSEFGFDFLRDNMKLSTEEQVQKHRDFCIVDEIDSILIDEARTPLIISGPAHDDAPQYIQANAVAEQLAARQKAANSETAKRLRADGFVGEQAKQHRVAESEIERIIAKFRDLGADYLDEKESEKIDHTQFYVVKKEQKQASMTHVGVEEAQKIVGTRFYVVGNDMAWDHLINQAVRAHAVYEKDREYVVQNGEVIIVDEFTGRLMIGRQWSDGLHQAVEAKEAKNGVKIKQETQTLATITIQNFFKLYRRLAGMTGTAMTEATEFMEIYDLDAVAIPTNRSVVRNDYDDLIFLTEKAKWNAIVDDIKETAEAGRPVLVGTTSVDKSEVLSGLLTRRHGLDHEVLNAKQHEREAHIVAKAGQQHVDNRGRNIGNVTIATNMAGRGTDIRLTPEVLALGGLHIVGTERHESRRIDNQLRGRAGRQGDPGDSRFFISMEDDLMKMFAGKTTMKALAMLGMKEDDAIEHRWITRSVEKAQRKVEERNFQIRKNLLEYDEVMEYQRNYFYGTRQKVLEGHDVEELIFGHIAATVEDAVGLYLSPAFVPDQLAAAVRTMIGATVEPSRLKLDDVDSLARRIREDAKSEIRSEIENSLAEYASDDVPVEEWDAKGLSSWAMSRFHVDLKQAKIRESNPRELGELLTAAAFEQIDKRPLEGLARYLDPQYAAKELADWAKRKFDMQLPPEELMKGSSETANQAQQRVADLIFKKAREIYDKRQVEYPIQFALETAFGLAQQGREAGAWAADQLTRWAKQRYDLDWTAEHVGKLTLDELRKELVAAAHPWWGAKLDEWIGKTMPAQAGTPEKFEKRWGVKLDEKEWAAAADKAEYLRHQAKKMLRAELTQLERFVLLQILDTTWKDHLYAMDQLKDSVGLRGYAEKDPKIEYKSEGARMFQEMQKTIRDKTSELVFRAKLTPNVRMRNAYANQQAHHEAPVPGSGAAPAPGSSQEVAAGPTAQQRADMEAANRAGAERQVVQTIVNRQKHVGRNDPCPCGSGKKYKQCCGKNA